MITMTSAEAQNRFGELLDRSQREPVEVTRHGRAVAYVLSRHDMKALSNLRSRREAAVSWYSRYRTTIGAEGSDSLTDEDINKLVHELR